MHSEPSILPQTEPRTASPTQPIEPSAAKLPRRPRTTIELTREIIVSAVTTLRRRDVGRPFPAEVAKALKIPASSLRHWVRQHRGEPRISWSALGIRNDHGGKPSPEREWLGKFVQSLKRTTTQPLALITVLELYQTGKLNLKESVVLCVAIATKQHKSKRLDCAVAPTLKVTEHSLYYILHGKGPSRSVAPGIFALADSEFARRLAAEKSAHTRSKGHQLLATLNEARKAYVAQRPFSAALDLKLLPTKLAAQLTSISQQIPPVGTSNSWGLTKKERRVVDLVLANITSEPPRTREALAADANCSLSWFSGALHGKDGGRGAIAKIRHHAESVGGVSPAAHGFIAKLANGVKPSGRVLTEVRKLVAAVPDRDPPIRLSESELKLIAELIRRAAAGEPRTEQALATAIGITSSTAHVILCGRDNNIGAQAKMDLWISQRLGPECEASIKFIGEQAVRVGISGSAEEVCKLAHALGATHQLVPMLSAGYVDLVLASGQLPSLSVKRTILNRLTSDLTEDRERVAFVRMVFSGRYPSPYRAGAAISRASGVLPIVKVDFGNVSKFIHGRNDLSNPNEGALARFRARLLEDELETLLTSLSLIHI